MFAKSCRAVLINQLSRKMLFRASVLSFLTTVKLLLFSVCAIDFRILQSKPYGSILIFLVGFFF